MLITTSHHDPQAQSFRAEKLTKQYVRQAADGVLVRTLDSTRPRALTGSAVANRRVVVPMHCGIAVYGSA